MKKSFLIILCILVIVSLCSASYADNEYFQLFSTLQLIDVNNSSGIYDNWLSRTTLAISFLMDFCLNDVDPKFSQDDFIDRLQNGTLLVGRDKHKDKDFFYVGYYCDKAACAFYWIPPINQAQYKTFSGSKAQLRKQVEEWIELNADEYVSITEDELVIALQRLTQ